MGCGGAARFLASVVLPRAASRALQHGEKRAAPRSLHSVREEIGPGGGGDGEKGAVGVLGVPDVDGVGAGGYFDAVAAAAVAVAGLDPPKDVGAGHRFSPANRSTRPSESSGLRACARIFAYR